MSRINWQNTPLGFVPKTVIACPHCHSVVPSILIRSQAQGDGSTLQKRVCRKCSAPFRTVTEPSEFDIANDWQT
jgi:hypothetical protein